MHYRHGPIIADTGVVYVRPAPPPPRRFQRPPRPVAGAIWIGGYWRWAGNRYVWRRGYWERTPKVGATWTPGRWIHTRRGWYWRPGYWR
ncbi:MAG: hypothetical protein AAGJ73_16265 [Pseudomonadota bacterium]